MTEQEWYSVREVAERYRVASKTIIRWIDDGLFPGSVRKNPTNPLSHYEIPQSAIDHYEELRKAASEK